MLAVGIYGSPRQGGNSDLLLDCALRGAQKQGADIKKIYVRDLRISGCIECGGCEKTGACVLHDDMQEIYPLLDEAEVIVLSSPIFFYGLTSQVKALIDRSQAEWCKKRLRKGNEREKNDHKGRGYLIAVGATKGKNLFQGAQLIARYFFDALSMNYEGGLFFQGVESKGVVRDHPELLKSAYECGESIV